MKQKPEKARNFWLRTLSGMRQTQKFNSRPSMTTGRTLELS